MKRAFASLHSEQIVGPIFLFIAVILGRLFTLPAQEASTVWPAIGVAMGLVFFYGRRVVIGLWIAYALGYAASYAIAGMGGVLTYTLLPVLMGFAGLAPVCVGRHLAKVLRFKPSMQLNNVGRFFVFALSIAFMAALLGHVVYVSFGMIPVDGLMHSFIIWFFSDFFSLLIIGVPLYFAFHYDKHPLPTSFTRSEGFIYGAFILFSVVLILDILPLFTYNQHRYIYSIFAIVVGLRYPYRTTYMFSLILLALLLFVRPLFLLTDMTTTVVDINVFFALMTIIVLILKEYSRGIERARETNIHKSRRLDNLIAAMQRLLSFSAAFRSVDERKTHHLAKEMFDTVVALFPKADYGSVALVGKRIKFVACKGYDTDVLNAMKFSRDKWALDLTKPYRETRPMNRALSAFAGQAVMDKHPRIKESIYVAVQMTENVICSMSFDLDENNPVSFNEHDIAFFTSLQILFNSFYEAESLSATSDALRTPILRALLRTLETYDKGMRDHHLAVASTAEMIAINAGVETNVVEEIYWAGLVHDIGKLGIDEQVVKKTEVYSVADFEAMKHHPLHGYDVLIKSSELQAIAQYVRDHHERVDGSGYPDGLKNTEISLGGQIVGLAEVIVSMAQRQPYAVALPRESIVDELNRIRDKHFDTPLIDIAITLLETNQMPWIEEKR